MIHAGNIKIEKNNSRQYVYFIINFSIIFLFFFLNKKTFLFTFLNTHQILLSFYLKKYRTIRNNNQKINIVKNICIEILHDKLGHTINNIENNIIKDI